VIVMSREQTELGRLAARSTPSPMESMLPVFKRALAEHPWLDWMTWSLGYIRALACK